MCSKCNRSVPRATSSHTRRGLQRCEEERKGVVIKADTVGGLEALGFELAKIENPSAASNCGSCQQTGSHDAQIGTSTPLNKVILGFSVKAEHSEVAESLGDEDAEIKFLSGSIIYHILDAYEAWREELKEGTMRQLDENPRLSGTTSLPQGPHIPEQRAQRLLGCAWSGGRVHLGQRLMKLDGTPVGQIKSLRTRDQKMLKEAKQGDEVAVAISGPTVGRHIEELD